MKICFLVDNIHYLGGAQRCTVRLANGFVNKGNNVTIIYTNKDRLNNYNDYNLSKSVKLEYVKGNDFLPKLLFFWTKLFEKINNETEIIKNHERLLRFVYYGRRKFAIRRIQKKINDEHYDCVIGVGAFNTMMLTLLKKNGTKFIGWQHSTGVRHFECKGVLLWHQDILFKKALLYLDHYVVLTEVDAKYIKDRFGVNVNVIYNPTSFETDIKKYEENRTILAVGRYHEVKGFDLLIEAFKIFSEENTDWKLRIVGEGDQRQRLQNLINSYGLQDRVLLVGNTNNVISEYKKSDFFVLSSRIEGFGIVLIEAMECGLPIISFNLPCVSEIFTSNEGIVVDCFDVNKLAKSMKYLSENLELRKKMGKSSKKRAKIFEVNNILNKWIKLIK